MIGTLISHAFWIFFSLGALFAAVSLGTVLWQGFHLTGARPFIDDGSERPESVEAYALDRASTRLSIRAGCAAALLVCLGIAGALAGPFGQVAIVLATAMLALLADAMRTRHLRLEKRFDALWRAHEEKTDIRLDVEQRIAA